MHERGQLRDLDNLSDVFMYENVDERQHVLRKRSVSMSLRHLGVYVQ
jgi:hypothetical protein